MGFYRGYECGKCSRPRKLCYSSQVRVRAFVLLVRTRSGRSAAWLARLVRDQEVEGSNPFAPTTFLQTNQAVTATSCSTTASDLGSLGSIEANEAGTSKPTPQRFATSLRNATSFLIWS